MLDISELIKQKQAIDQLGLTLKRRDLSSDEIGQYFKKYEDRRYEFKRTLTKKIPVLGGVIARLI